MLMTTTSGVLGEMRRLTSKGCDEESAVGWTDAQGYTCATGWQGYSCTDQQGAAWGYSATLMSDVRANCPVCCGLPSPSPPPPAPPAPPPLTCSGESAVGWTDAQGWGCDTGWQGYSCTDQQGAAWGYSAAQMGE
eukprot:1560882-Prymnesium_polylepis.1